MAKLYFKVGSDWEEVVRLRNEIVKLKQELMSMDGTQSPAAFKALNVQLAASNQRLDELVTNAAKAGAEMETGFKKGIYDGEKAVNSLSEEIIKQKDIIRETQNDVSMLTEQYKKLGKYDPKRQSLSDELNRAKAALGVSRQYRHVFRKIHAGFLVHRSLVYGSCTHRAALQLTDERLLAVQQVELVRVQ